ncbi:hypothetical protein KIH39_14385 [Telmatocola sphagniphila]|uniref:Uncharacterized protein n=1 Tax=Telmatocola sphagniphila TaxID=1123043 RepID=A0A8E6BAT1_9BACT|nr:hypothetical protein KIH39_14385 [Telmatocola sphagniphila]
MTTHLRRNQYGNFRLTDAIRPGPGLSIFPAEGYRVGMYRDSYTGKTLPMLSAAISAEKIFDLFLELIVPLGTTVHVILESSHDGSRDSVRCCRRTDIDTPVLSSYCWEFENLLLNDGCTALSVLADRKRLEVQFDEHKLFHVYGKRLKPFEKILENYGIPLNNELKLICEDEHLHHSTVRFQDEFQQLAERLGAELPSRVLSDSDDNGW